MFRRSAGEVPDRQWTSSRLSVCLQSTPLDRHCCSEGPSRHTHSQHQIPTAPVRIGSTSILPVSSVRNLGVYLDADATMTTHVKATVRSCFAALRQIRSVRRSLSQHALLTLIRALVVSKVDYCFSVLTGVSSHLLSRLQSIMNAAARLIFYDRRSEHVTPLLHDLHWLQVPERIQFRLCVLTFRCLHGSAPSYLPTVFVAPSMSPVVNVCVHPT